MLGRRMPIVVRVPVGKVLSTQLLGQVLPSQNIVAPGTGQGSCQNLQYQSPQYWPTCQVAVSRGVGDVEELCIVHVVYIFDRWIGRKTDRKGR